MNRAAMAYGRRASGDHTGRKEWAAADTRDTTIPVSARSPHDVLEPSCGEAVLVKHPLCSWDP